MKVPTKPPSNVEEVRNQYDQSLVRQLEEVESRSDAYPMGLTMFDFQLQSTSVLGRYGRALHCSTNSPQPKPEKSKSTFTALSTIRYVVPSYDL